MFDQRPLDPQFGRLGLGIRVKRVRACHIQARRDAAVHAVLGHLAAFAKSRQGVIENLPLDIVAAKSDVEVSQPGLQAETCIGEVRGSSLVARLALGHFIANAPPQVDLVASPEGNRSRVVFVGLPRTAQRPQVGLAIVRGTQLHVRLRPLLRTDHLQIRARRVQTGQRHADIGVAGVELSFQPVQHRIAVDIPPGAPGGGVIRLRQGPALRIDCALVESRQCADCRFDVVGCQGASAQCQQQTRAEGAHSHEVPACHAPLAVVEGEASWTLSPSPSESAG